MIVFKLSVVIFAACQLTGQVVQGAPQAPPPPPGMSGTSIYEDVWRRTPIIPELAALRTDIESRRTALRTQNFPVGTTIKINEFNILLKRMAIKFADVTIDYLEALENIVSTGNIPDEEIFEEFERPHKRFRKFLASDAAKFVLETRKLIGCPVARDFMSIFKNIDHQVEYIIPAIRRIKEAVEDKENKLELVLRKATIVFNRVVKIRNIIQIQIYSSLGDTINRIWLVNDLQNYLFMYQNATSQAVNQTILALGANITALNITAQNVYIEGQHSIRANLSSAITQLSVFHSNMRLAKLSRDIENNYHKLYHFLRVHNQSDLNNINKYYKSIYENSEGIIQNMTSILLAASNRTVLEYLDLIMNGYFTSVMDCSGQGYFLEAYDDFIASVNQCVEAENSIWNSTILALNSSVSLLQTSSNTVAASIARCSNPNFAQTPIFFARSKACLKSNVADSGRLVSVLKPQLEKADRLIQLDVEVSKFRLENCLATATHEITGMLKATRVIVRSCASRIDECPIEEKYEDNDGEFHWRYRDEVSSKEDDPQTSLPKGGLDEIVEYGHESIEKEVSVDSEEATS